MSATDNNSPANGGDHDRSASSSIVPSTPLIPAPDGSRAVPATRGSSQGSTKNRDSGAGPGGGARAADGQGRGGNGDGGSGGEVANGVSGDVGGGGLVDKGGG